MKAKYIKPEMEISAVVETEMLCGSIEHEGTHDGYFNSKERGRWVEDTDLWGNECLNYEED